MSTGVGWTGWLHGGWKWVMSKHTSSMREPRRRDLEWGRCSFTYKQSAMALGFVDSGYAIEPSWCDEARDAGLLKI